MSFAHACPNKLIMKKDMPTVIIFIIVLFLKRPNAEAIVFDDI